MWKFFHKLASPPHFYRIAKSMIPWFALPGLVLVAYGTYAGLFVAPADYQQGDAFRIIYVHVPSAYLSMMAYMIMAVSAGIGLIWRMKLAHAVSAAAAPLGAWFTFLALATGSIWGRPMWGTWWEWGDPRLTSRAGYAVSVFRLHGSAQRNRRHYQGRPGQRGVGTGWCSQCTYHSFLG